MVEKQTVIDLIEVLRSGQIQVRRADLYIEGGVEKAKSYHRHTLNPADSLTGQNARVKLVAQAVWTPAVIQAYNDSIK